MTIVVSAKDKDIVCKVINQGGVVAFPTETVYGVGVKFGSKKALDQLMKAKGRDYSKAITLMVADKEDIEKYAYVSDEAKKLIKYFMPGMLTLVFKRKESVDSAMTNGKETIGIRIPNNEYVLSILKRVGPMLVTSANLSRHPNTTSTREVLDQLDGRIDVVVDGKTYDNIASTVVDVSGEELKILREGKISRRKIEEVLK